MFIPRDDQGRCCPNCGDLIRANGDGAENSELGRELGQLATPHSPWIMEILESFYLSDEELAAVKRQIIPELIRRAPQFVKAVVTAVAVPVLQERVQRHYKAKGVPSSEAEELVGIFVLKIVKALFGEELRGNAGAWVTRVRNTVLADYGRAKQREERRFGKRKHPEALAAVASLDEESLSLFLEDLSAPSRELVQRLFENAKWAELAAHCQQKLDEARTPIQSIEWPEGSLPLRKRRRRQSS